MTKRVRLKFPSSPRDESGAHSHVAYRAMSHDSSELVFVVEEDINELNTMADMIASRFIRLLTPEFKEHDATGAQETTCLLDDAAKYLDPVKSTVVAQGGLEVESVARQEPQMRFGDVQCNPDNDITVCAVLGRHGGKGITLAVLDIIGAHT